MASDSTATPPLPVGTQAAVAKRLKLSVSFVSRIASGYQPATPKGARSVKRVREALEKEAERRRAILAEAQAA